MAAVSCETNISAGSPDFLSNPFLVSSDDNPRKVLAWSTRKGNLFHFPLYIFRITRYDGSGVNLHQYLVGARARRRQFLNVEHGYVSETTESQRLPFFL